MPEITDTGTADTDLPKGFAGTAVPAVPFSGTPEQSLTYLQQQQVRGMIEEAEKRIETELKVVQSSLEAKIGELPSRPELQRLARETRWWAIGTILAAFGLLIAMVALGVSQFGSGVQFATGTINYLLEAKKAQEETAKQFREVKELLLKQREEAAAKDKIK